MKDKCEKHGDYEAKEMELFGKKIKTDCPVCLTEKEADIDALINKKQDELNKKEISKNLEKAKIPERFKSSSFDNYLIENQGQEKVFGQVKNYLNLLENTKKLGSSLFLCGSYGTGKTHLAIASLIHLIKSQIMTGIYTTTMRMLRDIRSSYNRDNLLSEEQIINKYIQCGLLVLDEIGIQYGSDAEKLLIYEVINGRYENFKPSIIISNLPYSELKDYLGERSIDRLKDKNGDMAIFQWESYRNK